MNKIRDGNKDYQDDRNTHEPVAHDIIIWIDNSRTVWVHFFHILQLDERIKKEGDISLQCSAKVQSVKRLSKGDVLCCYRTLAQDYRFTGRDIDDGRGKPLRQFPYIYHQVDSFR